MPSQLQAEMKPLKKKLREFKKDGKKTLVWR